MAVNVVVAGPRRGVRAQDFATVLMSAALAASLIGAFIGLSVNSFWLDEFFTAWVVGSDHNVSQTLGRALTDLHPPLYYLSVFSFSQVFGAGEIGLRLFSALCAVAALLVFVLGADCFSVRARVFAGLLAAASTYWLAHSQEARSYAMGLLIASILLVSALRLVSGRGGRGARAAFMAASLAGCFTHDYLFLVAEAALAVIFVFDRRSRLWSVLWGLALLSATFAYLKLVINGHAQAESGAAVGWIGATPAWYGRELFFAVAQTAPKLGALGLLAVALAAWKFGRRRGLDAALLASLLVPVLVLIGGVAVSVLISPSFTDRNFLLSSPFIWACAAGLYDLGVEASGSATLAVIVALLTLPATGALAYRLVPHNAPFRDSAQWIAAEPGCTRAVIPVIIGGDSVTRSDFGRLQAKAAYGYYLPDHRLQMVSKDDILSGANPLPGANPPRGQCQVEAWAAHYIAGSEAEAIANRLGAKLKVFSVPKDRKGYFSAYVFLRPAPGPS